jgi:hypothetical protein
MKTGIIKSCFRYICILHLCFKFCLLQKACASSAALVSDYIGYLEKGQIPPKVNWSRITILVLTLCLLILTCADPVYNICRSCLQHISLVNSQVSLNIEGSKYTVHVIVILLYILYYSNEISIFFFLLWIFEDFCLMGSYNMHHSHFEKLDWHG